MSDILIKGMEVPDCCGVCPLLGNSVAASYRCVPTGKKFLKKGLLRKRKDCPLVEVKPHGRLIDADELLKGFSDCEMKAYGYNGSCDDCDDRNICMVRVLLKDIEDAPTVLEATE